MPHVHKSLNAMSHMHQKKQPVYDSGLSRTGRPEDEYGEDADVLRRPITIRTSVTLAFSLK